MPFTADDFYVRFSEMKTVFIIILIIAAALAYYYFVTRADERGPATEPARRPSDAAESGPGVIDYATGKHATDQFHRARKEIERVKKLKKPAPDF